MIEKNYLFAVDKVEQIDFQDYQDDEFAIVRLGFLSDRPNAHKLDISKDVLKECAKTVLGKFVIGKIFWGDTMGHEDKEQMFGYVPKDQDVVFKEEKDDEGNTYTRAYANAVISKIYAADFCDIINRDETKSVSVEMKVTTPSEDDSKVLSFRIFGVTVLGKTISPSCPNSTIQLVRFSEKEAKSFYNKINKSSKTQLCQFAENRRKQLMAEEKKTYKVDKSKEALSDKAWGDVDKTILRDAVMSAKNKVTLAKDVYMLVEEGWEESPSEHLKYPVMELNGDTFVYNRDGLASALGYAKKENETGVVSKVEAIYKKLGLNSEEKEEDKKMAEVKFATVDIGDMWGKLWDALHAKYPDGDYSSVYRIDGIYEEDNKKFAIIRHKDEDAKYRLDFSLTEDGIELADEIVKVEIEIVETEEIRKFAEPEDAEKYKKFEGKCNCPEDEHDDEHKMSCDEMMAEIEKMKADIESRDNIIMEKDATIKELQDFKTNIEEKEKAMSVEATMADVKEFVDSVKFSELRDEGMACNLDTLDAWTNKVKSVAFDSGKKPNQKKDNLGVWSFATPTDKPNKSDSVWDRI